MPGSILSDVSVGPNTLLRLGARPMLTPHDVFDAIGHLTTESLGERGEAHPLLAYLPAGERATTDELVARSGLSVAEIHAALLELELGSLVERMPDGSFQQVRPPLPGE